MSSLITNSSTPTPTPTTPTPTPTPNNSINLNNNNNNNLNNNNLNNSNNNLNNLNNLQLKLKLKQISPPPRPRRRMSSPGITQLTIPSSPRPTSDSHSLLLDDILIGGECGLLNGGKAEITDPNPPTSQNWIAHHLSLVLKHSFTVSSPHPISQNSQTPPHYHQQQHLPKSHFLNFNDSEHLRNKFSITSLSSFTSTTSTTTDEEEEDGTTTDEVEEADSQDSTASSCFFLDLNNHHHQTNQQPPSSSSDFFSSDSSHSHSHSHSPLPQSYPSPPLSSTCQSSSRLELIQILNTWSFDANSLSTAQIRGSLHILLSVYLNYTPGFIHKLTQLGVLAPEECLRGLVDNLEAAYDSRNAYHNFRHAVDVVQAVYTILSHEGIVPPLGWVLEKESGSPKAELLWHRRPVGRIGFLLDEMTVWALLLAAAGHDVGHPGLSNAFMVNARTPIAYVFSDGAVLENFHRITFTRMLREHGFEKLVDGHAGFRQVLVGAVLSTDMGRHFPIVEQLKRLACDWSQPPSSTDDSGSDMGELAEKVLITAGLIKCGDISNSSRPHHISLTWSSCLLTEWSRQAALEADLHLPVSVVTLDPAEKRAQAKSQIGFTSLFVLPLFTVMEQLSPKAFRPFADNCRLGLTTWQNVVEHIDSQVLGGSEILTPVSPSSQLPSPLSVNSIQSGPPDPGTLQDSSTTGYCTTELTFSPLSGSPCSSLPSISQTYPNPNNPDNHLTPKSTSTGWWAGPSSLPNSDDYNAEDSNLSSISSSSVSTLRDSSHLPSSGDQDSKSLLLDPTLINNFSSTRQLNGPAAIQPTPNKSPHHSFSFKVSLSHPDRHSNASTSSDEGKANSSNDDSSFSSLGSPSSPPRSPYFNSEVYSASSTGSSSNDVPPRARVVCKQVEFNPLLDTHLSSQHLQSTQRSRDKGMSVDAGVGRRNLTRTSLPLRKKSYSPHLVNQQVACAKGCGKVTVKCVKCATESKIKMYRSLSLAKPPLVYCTGLVARSPPGQPSEITGLRAQCHPLARNHSSFAPAQASNLGSLARLAEEHLPLVPPASGLPHPELAWPPHPFRPLC